MSYLVYSQGEGDDGQGLQELWGLPGRVLGVGAVHKAKEMQHTIREGPLPGAVSKTCQGLSIHVMRGVQCREPEDLKSRQNTSFQRLSTRHLIARPLRLWVATDTGHELGKGSTCAGIVPRLSHVLLTSQQPSVVGPLFTPILQMGRQRHREVQ